MKRGVHTDVVTSLQVKNSDDKFRCLSVSEKMSMKGCSGSMFQLLPSLIKLVSPLQIVSEIHVRSYCVRSLVCAFFALFLKLTIVYPVMSLWKVKVSNTPWRRISCLIKCHAIKRFWRSGGIAPRILNLCITWRWVVSFTLRPFNSLGNSPRYPLVKRLGRPQCQSGRGGEEKRSLPLLGMEPRSSRP